jgi:hypothetical protein
VQYLCLTNIQHAKVCAENVLKFHLNKPLKVYKKQQNNIVVTIGPVSHIENTPDRVLDADLSHRRAVLDIYSC